MVELCTDINIFKVKNWKERSALYCSAIQEEEEEKEKGADEEEKEVYEDEEEKEEEKEKKQKKCINKTE